MSDDDRQAPLPKDALRQLSARMAGGMIRIFARLLTAVQAEWRGSEPLARKRIYYANHNSHGDFILIWSVLPIQARRRCRPVAGADYWDRGPLRRFIGRDVFNAVLIDRERRSNGADPIATMAGALDRGDSLILFPEGTRNLTDQLLLPFRSGIYRLAAARPEVELVPVWIENLNRVLPKGEIVPVPIMCKVIFGAPMRPRADEDRNAFLARARAALLALQGDVAGDTPADATTEQTS